ncbi:MAG TPA: CHAD domain-containing protein [Ktedonobacteraceae bacterium]
MAKARPITGLDSQAPTSRNARAILQQRLDEMYAYSPYVENPNNIQELHDLRIATKRVRYTLELFEEFLPAHSKDFVAELTKLQDELGALHDSEVMLALLRQLLQQEHDRTQAQEHPPTRKAERGPVERRSELLTPEMEHAVLYPAHASALSVKERQGLVSFLQRQEQRREQSHALFRQHWEKLEQRQFYKAVLEMLSSTS